MCWFTIVYNYILYTEKRLSQAVCQIKSRSDVNGAWLVLIKWQDTDCVHYIEGRLNNMTLYSYMFRIICHNFSYVKCQSGSPCVDSK